MKYIVSFCFLLASGWLSAQRVLIPMNDAWMFTTDKSVQPNTIPSGNIWKQVTLPHTWNTDDVMDDVPGYYRGDGWYGKTIRLDKSIRNKEVYLAFEGANQVTTLYINGKEVGAHTGGYNAFNFLITNYLNWDTENRILIKVDNSYNPNIPPLSADFTFYGGIYRNVQLIATDPVHFSMNDYGSKSVFITTPVVDEKKATVAVKGQITAKNTGKLKLISSVYNKEGKKVTEATTLLNISGEVTSFQQSLPAIKTPKLWSPSDPYLYKVSTRILNASTGKLLDEIVNPLGLRYFRFDAGNGFILNGKPLKLVGTSRHQDYKGLGNAVPTSLARKDIELIKEMGGNFLRVAHYPQEPAVLQACDELGILASVEIPVVNEITESESFYDNCENMQVEMIRQNFNHPSVILWCYMNEVLLRPRYNNDREKQKIYFSNINQLAKRLDSITRKEDPSRYTMIAHHGDFKKYRDVGLIDIPQVVGWNLYSGWYGANLGDFPVFLDQFHKEYPNKPMTVSEYGADADPRIRSKEPVRFDKSVEYATMFHQFYYKEMMKRPFVAAAMIWNLADFNSETRGESMPHINNKGLMEWDRKPKDGYYFYKAMLAKKPFVKILGGSIRGGVADTLQVKSKQSIQVASNLPAIELYINGKSLGIKQVVEGIAEWQTPMNAGINELLAKSIQNGNNFTDQSTVNCRIQPFIFAASEAPFNQMNILLGAKRYFLDKDEQLWIPDQEYHEGGWGCVGGKAFKIPNSGRLPYGTDKDIRGTDNDPVYQTQQMGIEKYRFDVPAGEYELTMHFSELLGGPNKELVYNLDPSERIEPNGRRIFDVLVNNQLVLESFNLAEQYGIASAVARIVKVSVKDNKGIEIRFRSVEGESVLNALQLKKLYLAKPEESNVLK